MERWSIGAAIAVGIGVGVALAASMGPAGYALGLAAAIVPVGISRLRMGRR